MIISLSEYVWNASTTSPLGVWEDKGTWQPGIRKPMSDYMVFKTAYYSLQYLSRFVNRNFVNIVEMFVITGRVGKKYRKMAYPANSNELPGWD